MNKQVKVSKEKVQKVIEQMAIDCSGQEGRPNDVKFQFCIIEDVVLLEMRTRYSRVERLILSKLAKKLQHQFGLKLNDGFDTFEGIDSNFSIQRWDLFGEFATIRTVRYNHLLAPYVRDQAIGEIIWSKHVEEIYKAQGLNPAEDSFSYPDNAEGWEQYQVDYERIYKQAMPVLAI